MLRKKKKENPEYNLQCSCVAWFKQTYPTLFLIGFNISSFPERL